MAETRTDNPMSMSNRGRKGALARMAKYGNPGTPEGRIKGGRNSIKSQIESGMESPFVAKSVHIPEHCLELAEFVGILLGDGTINNSQVSISLNRNDDKEYVGYVIELINKLFNIEPSVIDREKHGVIIIVISRVNVIRYLQSIGMKVCNKVRQQADVPDWISRNESYSRWCVRGLIDTDGCIFIDKHRINNRLYEHLGINFTNRSIPILNFVKSVWSKSGYHPTTNGPYSIYVRKGKDIVDYMEKCGSSNDKIVHIYERYMMKRGRVPKRS